MIQSDETKSDDAVACKLRLLHESRVLHAQIKGLNALLQLQKWQVAALEDRLHAQTPGGVAARRLLALKNSERP